MEFRLNLRSFFLCIGLLFIFSLAEDTPLTPSSETGTFDLKVNEKIVAKIQGRIEWNVKYADNKNANFTVPSELAKNVTITGSQTATVTEFELSWDQESDSSSEESSTRRFSWKATFKKAQDGKVTIDQSILTYWMPDGANSIALWKGPIQLSSKSNLAFKCSAIHIANQKDEFIDFTNAKIQPFDLQNQKFGEDEICPHDLSTTTLSPTTVVPTTPKPHPKGNWTVSDDGRYTCIRLEGNIMLNFKYQGKEGQNLTTSVHVPIHAQVTGASTCSYDFETGRLRQDEQILQLKFDKHHHPWLLTINFTNNSIYTKDSSHQTVQAYFVRLNYYTDAEAFPNITNPDEQMEIFNKVNITGGQGALAMFRQSDQSHYYRCNVNDTTDVVDDFSISTQSLKIEAFLPNSTDFLKEQVCPGDIANEPVDWVPIIIGAALTALVVFVLIAYLVGRHRAKASTYETI